MSKLELAIDAFAREPMQWRDRLRDAIRAEIDERIRLAMISGIEVNGRRFLVQGNVVPNINYDGLAKRE